MYNELPTSESMMILIVKEQQNVAATARNLDYTRGKVRDFKVQSQGFKSSLAVHEATLKQLQAHVNFLNQNLKDKESMVRELNSSTEGLIKEAAELRKRIASGQDNLNKILQTQTDTFLALENVNDEKIELEQNLEKQRKLIQEVPSENGLGFFEKIKQRQQASVLRGELNRLGSMMQSKQTKEQELNAEIARLKIDRRELDTVLQSNVLLLATREKHIQQNWAMLKVRSAELERVRAEVQVAKTRCLIANDKVINLREQIAEKRNDIASSCNAVLQLEQTLAKGQASVLEKKRTHAEVSDEVTLSIADDG